MQHLPTNMLSARYIDRGPNAKFGYKTNVGAGSVFHIGSENKNSVYGPFQCCGAQVLHGLVAGFKNDQQKEDLLTLWLRSRGDYLSWYFIASTSQLKYPMVLFLMDLGAQQVDERPNRYHGPNNMHLFVLDLVPQNENLKKYVTLLGPDPDARTDTFNHKPNIWVPNWWTKLDDEAQKRWLDERAPAMKLELEEQEKHQLTLAAAEKKERAWNFAFAQQYGQGQNHIDLDNLAKMCILYGEKRLMKSLADNFQKFINTIEGKY